ncbi:MAG: type III secretion system export apparatus subunit SctU [Betaproteobacteria bacterium]
MSEKTEQPTPKKIREAREKGEVAKSRDFTQTALVIGMFGYIIAQGRDIAMSIGQLISLPLNYIAADFGFAVSTIVEDMILRGFSLTLPFVGIVLGLGIVIEALPTGMLISFKALMPSAKKLNFIENAKNIFSKNNLVEFIKSTLKILIISYVVYIFILDAIPALMMAPYYTIADIGTIFAELLKNIILYVGLCYVVISLADFAWQRHSYTKKLMMSKDEVKQEYKTMEGDPHIKSQRKHLHQELMQEDSVQRTRSASVVVTNPTHLAVALHYDEQETPLPVVVAKGEGYLASRMIEAAREAGVPVMQNIPLARALFEQGNVDHYVPSDLIEPVAAVLRLVSELGRRGIDP